MHAAPGLLVVQFNFSTSQIVVTDKSLYVPSCLMPSLFCFFKLRKHIINLHPDNQRHLDVIETATSLFVLDSRSPENITEVTLTFVYLGN